AGRHVADNRLERVGGEVEAAPFQVFVLRVAGFDRYNRRDEGISKLARNRLTCLSQDDIMFRSDEVRTVLLGAARHDQRGCLSGLQRVADLELGELLDPDAVDG